MTCKDAACRPAVLLVDDSEDFIVLMAHMLTALGDFEVQTASSPTEAIEKFNLRCGHCPEEEEEMRRAGSGPCFDLLILDIDMPVMTGISFAKLALVENPLIGLIFVTAYGSPEAREIIARLGGHFVDKPIMDLDEFVQLCRREASLAAREEKRRAPHTAHDIEVPPVLKEMVGRISG